jgi:hypothetical protein
MAFWTRIIVPNLEDLLDELNNVLIGTANISGGADVDGLTFIVDPGTPRTATFTPAKNRLWTPEEVVDHINAAHGDLAGSASAKVMKTGGVAVGDRRLVMWLEGGLTVDKDGTANSVLGFSTTADQVQAVPRANTIVQYLDRDESNQNWVAVIYE